MEAANNQLTSVVVTRPNTETSGLVFWKNSINKTESQCLVEADKEYNAAPVRKFDEIYYNDCMFINAIRKDYGKMPLQAYIMAGLMDLQGFLNLNQDLDINQMRSIADLIIEEYSDVPLDLFKAFIKEVKLGKFGKIYGRLGGQDIMTWFGQYYNQYWNYYIEQRQREHEQAKASLANAKFLSIAPDDDEEVQRIKNRLTGHGSKTDFEVEEEKEIAEIRREIIMKNQSLFSTLPYAEAEKKINDMIDSALITKGLFRKIA